MDEKRHDLDSLPSHAAQQSETRAVPVVNFTDAQLHFAATYLPNNVRRNVWEAKASLVSYKTGADL